MEHEAAQSPTAKKRGRPPKTPALVAETNSVNTQETPVLNECSSYESRVSMSKTYFGLDIFDLYGAEQLSALVRDPIANNELLREISLILYGTNGAYTNTVDYMVAMPTLDKVIVPHGKSKEKKKKNKELMESTLRTIKDKEIIRDALWRGMIDGIAFYYFETAVRPGFSRRNFTDYDVESIAEINEYSVNASIISLPVDYTRIVGIKNNSYVVAFNLDFFTDANGEDTEKKLRKYPDEIRKAYQNRRDGKTTGNWVILDNTKTIVHKIRSSRSEKYGRPLVLAAINDILYSDYFTATKRNVLGEINNKVIYQTFPEGQNKGTSSLTTKQQEKQHETVKTGIMQKNNRGGTSFFSVAAGTKLNALDVNNTDIFDQKYESNLGDKVALDLGIAASLLNGVGSGSYSAQQQNLELITAQLFQWVDQISEELNKCISANIIKDKTNWVECKYLPITSVNKGAMVGYAKDLYLLGKGSLSLWASACGISPDVFFALLDQEMEAGVEDRYPVHKTSYTVSARDQENKGGRPETINPTENTVKSRAANGNGTPTPADQK